jgi:hypothetical protein
MVSHTVVYSIAGQIWFVVGHTLFKFIQAGPTVLDSMAVCDFLLILSIQYIIPLDL